MPPRTLLRVADLAAYLGQSPDWCRTALADGTIPGARKVRGRWMVTQSDVDAWLDAGRPARPEPEGDPYRPFPEVMSETRRSAAA